MPAAADDRLSDRQIVAMLLDRLPHAIEAGCGAQAIAALKVCVAWHGLYPVEEAAQAWLQAFHTSADPVDSP